MKSFVSNKVKSQAEKIAWITFFWILVNLSQFMRGYLTLNRFDCLDEDFNVSSFFWGSVITGLIAGLSGGALVVFFWEKWLRSKPFGWSLVNMAWSFTLLFVFVAFVSGVLFIVVGRGIPVFSQEAWELLWSQFVSIDQLMVYLFWLSVVILTLIALSVNDKYGPGVFKSFILGKYFHPKREERIFMFLDLRGSTTIAEKLGEERYFNFLKDIFKDATPAILNAKGQIYQYVGDEIVISWKTDSGIEDANCLQCYFDIEKRLMDKGDHYRANYDDVLPKFKAGLHTGHVMVGEIGVVKRDIVYSGDVLNTAARIQAKCNELGRDIVFSDYLLEKLQPLPSAFQSIALGEMLLRGKQQTVTLYSLQ